MNKIQGRMRSIPPEKHPFSKMLVKFTFSSTTVYSTDGWRPPNITSVTTQLIREVVSCFYDILDLELFCALLFTSDMIRMQVMGYYNSINSICSNSHTIHLMTKLIFALRDENFITYDTRCASPVFATCRAKQGGRLKHWRKYHSQYQPNSAWITLCSITGHCGSWKRYSDVTAGRRIAFLSRGFFTCERFPPSDWNLR